MKKTDSKLNTQKTKIMASDPITSLQIEGEEVEAMTDFILGALKSQWTMTVALKLEDDCFLAGKLRASQVALVVKNPSPIAGD